MADIFVKTDLTGTKAEGWIKDGGTWHKLGGAGGLPGLGGWAEITAVTGSPKRYAYTDADGIEWVAFEWTGDGTVTTTKGLLDLFVIGGGGSGFRDPTGGQPGAGGKCMYGVFEIPAGTTQCTVGAGAPANHNNTPGGVSRFGTVIGGTSTGWGGDGAGIWLGGAYTTGVTSSITGTAVTYGGGNGTTWPAPGSGGKGGTGSGADGGKAGIVVVRVPKASVTATTGWV